MTEALRLLANRLLRELFPEAQVAFLAGSVVRGEGTATSDLDLVVVALHDDETPYRKSLIYSDWPVELFVHSLASLRSFWASDCQRRRPSLPQMCVEGLVLRDLQGLAEGLKQEARACLEAGPPALTELEQQQMRYQITDLLADFEGSRVYEETLFIVPALVAASIDFYLDMKRAWSGQGKWRWRALKRANAAEAEALSQVLHAFYAEANREPLGAWVRQVLAPHGGTFFAGFELKAQNAIAESTALPRPSPLESR